MRTLLTKVLDQTMCILWGNSSFLYNEYLMTEDFTLLPARIDLNIYF